MIGDISKDADRRMRKTIDTLGDELGRLRTGRAHPSLVEHINVEYYGSQVTLPGVATIAVEDARTLSIRPWEKAMVPAVEKAIIDSDLGLTPVSAGNVIRVPLPPMTEERRKHLVRLVGQEGGDDTLARDLALQIAAAAPGYVDVEDVPSEVLKNERDVFSAQAAAEGKPPHIVEKMVEGRLRKYLEEITLLGQAFVKDSDVRIRELLARHEARVLRFVRFEVGEGTEKEEVDFASEVMAQVAESR